MDLGFARVDVGRAARTGDPEVVFGQGKEPSQILEILDILVSAHPERAILATRCRADVQDLCRTRFPDAVVDRVGRTVTIGLASEARGSVVVVAAGTSDLPVAYEAAATVSAFGGAVEVIADVGVAGLHRLLAVQDRLSTADVVVAVAGMEGALPSVIGGLVGTPLIAVPTSVGYGLSLDGLAALLAMLNSCAPGVTVVNIDNGFGAGVAAARIARAVAGG